MKVGFNARLLWAPTLRGWNRYAVSLLAELPTLGVEPFLYSDRPLHQEHLARLPADRYRVRVAAAMRYPLWEQRWLPAQCVRDRVELLHCPFHFGLPWMSPCPRVLTLHDAIESVYYRPAQSWKARLAPAAWRTKFYRWAARTCAERIITVSEHARADLVKHLHLPTSRITVIPEAASAAFHRTISADERHAVRAQYRLPQRYVFYIGGWEQRKNVSFLVSAFAAAGLHQVALVLAGGHQQEAGDLRRQAEGLGLADRIHLLEWVSEADLPALYAEALCFVYPSAYEGFGLQLCEALAAGCPTFAARATSLPEVLGDGGATFALGDPTELVRLLRRVANDTNYRVDLVSRARNRAPTFDWRRTAACTLSVYRDVLQRKAA